MRAAWGTIVALLAGCSSLFDADGLSGGNPPPPPTAPRATLDRGRRRAHERRAPSRKTPIGRRARGGYGAEVLADEPLAYWRLSDFGGGTAVDQTGMYPGTYNGAVQFGMPGPLRGGTSKSVAFSGDARMNADALAKLPAATWQALTIEVWFLTADTDVAASIIGFFHVNGGNAPRLYRAEPSDFIRYLDVSGAMLFSTTQPAANVWYHVAVTIDAANLATVYVNGAPESTMEMITDRPMGNGFFALGVDYDPLADGGVAINDFWNGRLAEAAVYARALPAERIAAHYAARDL